MKWSYPILAFFIIVVIGFGLINVLKEDIQVAPWTEKGAMEGRLIAHTKNVTRLVAASPADLHAHLSEVIPYPETATFGKAPSADNWQTFVEESIQPDSLARHVLILPAGDVTALQWSLSAIYYAYYYGSPVLFAENGVVPAQQASRFQHLSAYLIGPAELLPDEAGDGFLAAERITADTPHELAVRIAEYRNPQTEFGWGRTYDRRNGYFHYIVTTPHDALMGLAALAYARTNNASLLYAKEDGGIPAVLDRYIWTQRADWFVTPSEGPFRHFWIVSNRISYAAQSRMDFAVEKAEYASMGAVGLGPLEGLLLLFVIWGIASGMFVWVHAVYVLPMVRMPIKIGWALSSLLLPVLGPILYLNSYRRPAWQTEDGEWRWLRPHSLQSATATAMGFGYGAPLMIAVGFLFVWFGFPIFYPEWLADDFFWIGAGMPIMMFAMFVLAVLTAFIVVQYPMKKSMMPMPRQQLLKMAFITTFFSMAAVSLGMMTGSWYMLMDKIPMMPKEDDSLWFGSMWLVSFLGFLVAWPLNWLMIRSHLKPGNV